jgi:multiple antibiotic resistance protein
MNEFVEAFLLAFPAIFSVANPIGGAFVFQAMVANRTAAERTAVARQVGFFSAIVLLVALWSGSEILDFFGVSLAALRCAGGVIIALNAWQLLNAPDQGEPLLQSEKAHISFFPLTIPITAGPGSISVAVALSSEHPTNLKSELWFFMGASAAAIGVAISIWFAFRASHGIIRLFGENGNRVFGRLMAFLLFCIGFQVAFTGIQTLIQTIG